MKKHESRIVKQEEYGIFKFKIPNKHERTNAMGLAGESTLLKKLLTCKLDEYFEVVDIPEFGDWLMTHKEFGQTFEEYSKTSAKLMTKEKNIIYIVSISYSMSSNMNPDFIMGLKMLTESYFYGTRIKFINKFFDLNKYQISTKMNSESKKIQISSLQLASYIYQDIPNDAYCVIAFTDQDLFEIDYSETEEGNEGDEFPNNEEEYNEEDNNQYSNENKNMNEYDYNNNISDNNTEIKNNPINETNINTNTNKEYNIKDTYKDTFRISNNNDNNTNNNYEDKNNYHDMINNIQEDNNTQEIDKNPKNIIKDTDIYDNNAENIIQDEEIPKTDEIIGNMPISNTYTFGYSSVKQRIALFSFARYDPLFYTSEFNNDKKVGQDLIQKFFSILLRRSCKVLINKICLMMGLKNCIYYKCVMNGSNSMEEFDKKPLELCPVCLRKVFYVIGNKSKNSRISNPNIIYDRTIKLRDTLNDYFSGSFDIEIDWFNSRVDDLVEEL